MNPNTRTSLIRRAFNHSAIVARTLISLAFLLPAVGRAQLSWDSRQLDMRPTGAEPAVVGNFEFTNAGTRPVTIVDVKSSCGCTTAALAKKTYAPQEKGKITATFTIGERQGFQQKQIMVTTDDAAEPYTQLTVRVMIPELLRMEPAALQWAVGGENGARVVKLTVGTGQPVHVLGVRTSDERLFATLKPVEPGHSYEVTVTADSTAQPLRGMLRIETDFPPGRPKVYSVPVEVATPFLPPVSQGPAQPGTSAGSPPFPQALPPALQPSGYVAPMPGNQAFAPIQVAPLGRGVQSGMPRATGTGVAQAARAPVATGATAPGARTYNPAQQFPGMQPPRAGNVPATGAPAGEVPIAVPGR